MVDYIIQHNSSWPYSIWEQKIKSLNYQILLLHYENTEDISSKYKKEKSYEFKISMVLLCYFSGYSDFSSIMQPSLQNCRLDFKSQLSKEESESPTIFLPFAATMVSK